jgi:hypothetical protein
VKRQGVTVARTYGNLPMISLNRLAFLSPTWEGQGQILAQGVATRLGN